MLSPGGSGYFTCVQNMKLVTNKFKSERLHEKRSGNLECWEPSQHLLIDTGKPRKTCVEVAGRRTFRILSLTLYYRHIYSPITWVNFKKMPPETSTSSCIFSTKRIEFSE